MTKRRTAERLHAADATNGGARTERERRGGAQPRSAQAEPRRRVPTHGPQRMRVLTPHSRSDSERRRVQYRGRCGMGEPPGTDVAEVSPVAEPAGAALADAHRRRHAGLVGGSRPSTYIHMSEPCARRGPLKSTNSSAAGSKHTLRKRHWRRHPSPLHASRPISMWPKGIWPMMYSSPPASQSTAVPRSSSTPSRGRGVQLTITALSARETAPVCPTNRAVSVYRPAPIAGNPPIATDSPFAVCEVEHISTAREWAESTATLVGCIVSVAQPCAGITKSLICTSQQPLRLLHQNTVWFAC